VRALGIDPGSRVTGWGVVERTGGAYRELASGTIRLGTATAIADRLARLHAECLRLFDAWTPGVVVVERNFVAHNVQSAFRIGEVRGVVLAAAAAAGLDVHEYAPAAVKLAAVGHGAADKQTMMRGVTALLGLAAAPPADAADALAVALCHLQQAPLAAAIARAERAARP
jgi:crossover junction endodeoxyribonuclease RuvC